MSYNIELRWLRYFRVLAEESHFNKAAARLYISQPALSKQIKLLESRLGHELIERTNRKFTLTPAGSYLAKETRFLENYLDECIQHTRSIAAGYSGHLRLGFVGSAVNEIIPSFMKALNENIAKMTTSLNEMANNVQIEKLLKNEIDLGFLRQKWLPKSLTAVHLHQDTFSLVVNRESKRKGTTKTVSSYKEVPFILFAKEYSPDYYDTVVSICRDNGFDPIVHHETVHAKTIFNLVKMNLGVSIIPSILIDPSFTEVEYIDLSHLPQRTSLYAAFNPDNRNPALKSVIAVLRAFQLPS